MIEKLLGVFAVAVLSSGCLLVNGVNSAIDCQGICDKYASCYDSKYDVSACASRCRTNAANDSSYRTKADACNTCLGDRSCVSATFSCITECASTVP